MFIMLPYIIERGITMANADKKGVWIRYKKPGINAKGLLPRFLKEKEKDYEEPTRKGTPKGENIGFSLQKYRATLYALTSVDLTEMSKKLGVSYGLLRKWRTEPTFKEQIEEHIQNFAPLFVGSLLKKLVVMDEGFAEYYDTSGGITGYDLNDYNPDLLEDEVTLYSSSLKKVLIQKLFALGREDSFLFLLLPFINICGSLADDKTSRQRLLFEVLNEQKNTDRNIAELIGMSLDILNDSKRLESERGTWTKYLEEAKGLAMRQERVREELEIILKKAK
jgi:hypothetical protein